jgi:hypothetical protein
VDDLIPAYEPASGQLILDGVPAGPAGEAGLMPVPGLDLAFDRGDGHLVRVIVDDDSAPATGWLTRLFGPLAADAFSGAGALGAPGTPGAPLSPEAGLCSALSSLARLDAARVTSPDLGRSPWWAAESAVLAQRAGLPGRALADARRAVAALASGPLAVTGEAARTALAAAAIAAAADPAAARRLRAGIVAAAPVPAVWPGLDVAAEVSELRTGRAGGSGPHRVLDPGLMRAGGLRPGLTPHSDLLVRDQGDGRLVVQATLAPGAGRPGASAAFPGHARLVDPAVRRVLARGDFRPEGAVIRATLAVPFPLEELSGTWIEVTEAGERSVASARAHWIRQALRWADAALRAERAPAGLVPRSTRADWAALAALSWERCGRAWAAAADQDRAAAALAPQTPLAPRAPLAGPAYLAEVVGSPEDAARCPG